MIDQKEIKQIKHASYFNIIITSASNHSAYDIGAYLLNSMTRCLAASMVHALPRYALSSASDGALWANHEREKAPAHQRRPLQGSGVTCTTSDNGDGMCFQFYILYISVHTICTTTSNFLQMLSLKSDPKAHLNYKSSGIYMNLIRNWYESCCSEHIPIL